MSVLLVSKNSGRFKVLQSFGSTKYNEELERQLKEKKYDLSPKKVIETLQSNYQIE